MGPGIQFSETLSFGICQYALWNLLCARSVSPTSRSPVSTVTLVIAAFVLSHLYYKNSLVPVCLTPVLPNSNSRLWVMELTPRHGCYHVAPSSTSAKGLPHFFTQENSSLHYLTRPWGEKVTQECLVIIAWEILRRAVACPSY